MTITAASSPAAVVPFTFTTVSAAPAWTQVGPAVWSATQGTEFLGSIEYADYTFTAFDRAGAAIGSYPSFAEATTQVLHPTSRAYLARHHTNTLLPAAPRTLHGRIAAAALGVATATVAAASLMIGTPHA